MTQTALELNDRRKTLVYCRESRDDYGADYERIETQRDMLLDFCKKRHLVNIVDVIMDDDVSGTSFKRFEKIILKIKSEKIQVIVFKDSSRLGRNLLESLKLIQTFEERGVEILFVTEDYNEDVFPLFAWFNEQRAKEDSKKIRNVFTHKMRLGELLIKPVYGYKKSPENKLIVDEVTGEIVKRIFQLFLDGNGTNEIATIFNYEGIPTPSQVNAQKNQCSAWNRQHIWRILGREEYTGLQEYSKRTVASFKNKKVLNRDKKDWIVIENHHEPIIPTNTFNQAQAMRKKLSQMRKPLPFHPFSGVLSCGRCGHSLVVRTSKEYGLYYICAKNNREGGVKDHIREDYGCTTHRISEKQLIEFAKEYVNTILLLKNVEAEKIIMDGQAKDNENVDKEILTLKSAIASTNKILEQIYDDKLKGVIPSNLFNNKYQQYSTVLERSELRLAEINTASTNKVADIPIKQNVMADMARRINQGQLDRLLIQSVFDKLIFFDKHEITSQQKNEYDLSDDAFQYLLNFGGVLVVENLRSGLTIAQL